MYIHKQEIAKIIQYLSILCVSSLVHKVLLCFASLRISYGLGCQVNTEAAPQHQIINVQSVHLHANWDGNSTTTISRSRLYYGSLGIKQPYFSNTFTTPHQKSPQPPQHPHQNSQNLHNILLYTSTLTSQPLATTFYFFSLVCNTKLHLFSLTTQAISEKSSVLFL